MSGSQVINQYFFQSPSCAAAAAAAAVKSLQSCPTVRPHGLQPTRLLRPWDFPGKSAGVGIVSSMVYFWKKE